MLSFNSYGETYMCAFKCLYQDDICDINFRRVNNDLFQIVYLESYGESTGDIWNIKENNLFLSMAKIDSPDEDSAWIHSAIINKNTMEFVMTQTSQNNIGLIKPIDTTLRLGKCQVN
jgi:hypothetical protein